jgi:hypothetical protein
MRVSHSLKMMPILFLLVSRSFSTFEVIFLFASTPPPEHSFEADTDNVAYISFICPGGRNLRSKILSIIGLSQAIMDDAYKHIHSMLKLAKTGSVLSHWLLMIVISFAFALSKWEPSI